MKFTILSHAGLLIEHRGTSLVIDPWLVSSCYWRSWWNFPEPPKELIDGLAPSAIYLTHLHWDHFHGVSLRRFSRETPVYVPRACTERMVRDLEWLGFTNVREIPHGGTVRLGDDLHLSSYQFGPAVDSAAVVQGGGVTLFDCNDSKCFGLPLDQIRSRFPSFDFAFRSHSSASAVPYCIEGWEQSFAGLRSADEYAEEFARFAIHIGAGHAVPFASNHCFLHRDTLRFNRTTTSPARVAERCNALAEREGSPTRAVVMAPGSSWSQEDGFSIEPFDYTRKDDYVEALRERHKDELERFYALEAREIADYPAFAAYFDAMMRSIPLPLRALGLDRFVFTTTDAERTHNWLVDLADMKTSIVDAPPADAIVIEVPPKVLNDCVKNRMFSVWTASKRLKVRLPSPDRIKGLGLFFSLLDAHELELLPLWKNLRPRALGVYARRYREALEAGRLVLKHKILGEPWDYKRLYTLPSEAAR